MQIVQTALCFTDRKLQRVQKRLNDAELLSDGFTDRKLQRVQKHSIKAVEIDASFTDRKLQRVQKLT